MNSVLNSRDLKDCDRLPVFQVDYPENADGLAILRCLFSQLSGCGLRVVCIVLPGHHLDCDLRVPGATPLVTAGCDVISLVGGRMHLSETIVSPDRIGIFLRDLCRHYDLVLVVGEADLNLPVLRLQEGSLPKVRLDDAGKCIHIIDISEDISLCSRYVVSLLGEITRLVPLWACVLIGGRSSRMGRAKHLLADGRGRTWLENTVARLDPAVDQVVLSGGGQVPESLRHLVRLPDIPGVGGPLAGILSAMRWQPDVTWLLVACDMPALSPEALGWLIESRRPGRWGTVPRRSLDSHVEPLLAHYDSRCQSIFEEILVSGSQRIGDAARHEKIATPVIPEQFLAAWNNINTPEELRLIKL